MRRFSLILITVSTLIFFGCKEQDNTGDPPMIDFITGEYTLDGDEVPLGGSLSFGIFANGGGAPLTNLMVQRIADGVAITEMDLGMYVDEEDYNHTLNAVKSGAQEEIWKFRVMNANRDTAVISLSVLLGEGTAWGPIKHFPLITIGMQNNTDYPHFLDLNTGETYTNETVAGNEASIDLLGFVYLTGGKMSPTLSCPQYTSVPGHYPIVENWTIRNSTLYDYNAVDFDLVDPAEFEAAANDSLLVVSYKPGSTSGNCKYCYTAKIVPFKTHAGKYGLIRVIHADEVPEGYMELEVKVQE